MATLDPKARKLLTLYLAGLSLPEMAAQMGESEDAISRTIVELVWETRERLAA
jgi:DNA-directed RNA polymerase specialized sigma24 family protein